MYAKNPEHFLYHKQLPQNYTEKKIPAADKTISNKKVLTTYIAVSAITLSTIAGGIMFLQETRKGKVSPYINELVQGLSKLTKKEIKPKQLQSIMDKEELLSTLANLKEENYIASAENISKGIFRADLHSHSNYSDGKGKVEDILDNVAQYADKLFEKTKNKFIFALSDHDGVKGVNKALTIIASSPEKFKNVRFVPAVELSFTHHAAKSSNSFETSEVLAYCINSFSPKLDKFLTDIQSKRELLMHNFYKDLEKMFPDVSFSYNEFAKHYNMMQPANYFKVNLQWKMYHYGQTKKAISEFAKTQNKNPNDLYSEIMNKTDNKKSLWDLKIKGLVPKNYSDDSRILDLCKKYIPHEVNGKIIADGENTFEEIIETFSDDKNTFLAFAHPYFFSERVNDVFQFSKTLIEKSKGLLKATETYHQAYDFVEIQKKIGGGNPQKAINDINSIILNVNNKLLPVGGRDSHNEIWLSAY